MLSVEKGRKNDSRMGRPAARLCVLKSMRGKNKNMIEWLTALVEAGGFEALDMPVKSAG